MNPECPFRPRLLVLVFIAAQEQSQIECTAHNFALGDPFVRATSECSGNWAPRQVRERIDCRDGVVTNTRVSDSAADAPDISPPIVGQTRGVLKGLANPRRADQD